MKRIFMSIPALALSGCLSSAPRPPVNWTIDISAPERVSSAIVCAPYGGQRFAVLRSGGSIAFDPFNSFAAAPGAIIRDAVVSRRGEGALVVRRIALDCRQPGRRDAVVDLEISLGGLAAAGSAAEPTADGNYSAAFSRAFARAYAKAHEGLKAAK